MTHEEFVRSRVSVIIPTRNRLGKLKRCISSVLKNSYTNVELRVVDDCSDENIARKLAEEFPQATVIRNDRRMLLAYSRNVGARASNGEYILFVDDDNVLHHEAIAELVKVAVSSPMVGVVCPIAYYWERPNSVWTYHVQKGILPGSYVLRTTPPKNNETFSFHNVFLVKRKVFEELGGFDVRGFPIHFSELDFAHQLRRKGYLALVAKEAKVWHDFGETRLHVDRVRAYYTLRNRIILMKRYAALGERIVYLLLVLPALLLYYLMHFSANSLEGGYRTSLELVKGVIHGLAYGGRFKAISHSRLITESARSLVTTPLVSVVIPTKNSGDTIGLCIDSLKQQTYPNLEVTVVDNYSSDRTREIASRYEGVNVLLGGKERSAQVNIGVKASKGEYVYRVDADFILEPGVVEEAVKACELGGFDMIAVHNTSDPRVSFWSRVRKLERDCYADDSLNIAARFFKRGIFKKVDGFDESLIASEDYDLHIRMVREGFRLGRTRSKEMHLREPKKLSEVVLKHVFYGKSMKRFIRKHPKKWLSHLSPVRVAYLRHWSDFRKDPVLTLGFLVYQYVRYTSALVGYLLTIGSE